MTTQGLTAITIENFKGIGQAVTIPLRPVTLLFGANSAGKSTIIQALQYAWEILENRNADVDRTRLGGEVIDLGGFQNLVHGHDLSRSISITLHYAGGLRSRGYVAPTFNETEFIDPFDATDGLRADATDWLDIKTISVKVMSSWEQGFGAYISSFEVTLDGALFGSIQADQGTNPELFINVDHPFFSRETMSGYSDDGRGMMNSILFFFSDPFLSAQRSLEDGTPTEPGELLRQLRSMLPSGESITAESDLPRFKIVRPSGSTADRHRFLVPTVIPEWGHHLNIRRTGGEEIEFASSTGTEFIWVLSQLLLGAGESVLHELRGLRYLGPLRAVPERTFNSPLRPDAARWANGLGAWDCLLRPPTTAEDGPTLIERCNKYLNEVLGLGYTVRRDSRIQLPDDSAILSELRLFAAQYDERDGAELRRRVLEPLERLPRIAALQLHDEKRDIDIEPMDIGVGVSQTLPVVVGAVEPNCTIFAVEQPELHIHPAVQVGLGDLFLREVLSEGSRSRKFLVETHSEHLVLRMMKRMRETCEGTLEGDFPEVTPEDVAILYVETVDGKTYVREMPLNERGELVKAWPGGFFEEALRETF